MRKNFELWMLADAPHNVVHKQLPQEKDLPCVHFLLLLHDLSSHCWFHLLHMAISILYTIFNSSMQFVIQQVIISS
uniref:Uncharacterized protein n=1 Tax=Rhizophora mucronata TaxID=61149 RepID=A0A2P2PIV7_RHIMU